MTARATIQLANHLAEIERVAGLVASFGREHGLPERAVFDVNLALDEILTNVISYGYDDDYEHVISVRLALGADGLRVEVEDDGREFDPLAVAEPDLSAPVEERPIGGLGLCLVRRLMTGLAYERRDGRNVFGMTRAIDAGTARAGR